MIEHKKYIDENSLVRSIPSMKDFIASRILTT